MTRYRYPRFLTHRAAREIISEAIDGLPVEADLTRNDWFTLDGADPVLVHAALKLDFKLDPAP